ncbi:MAG: hypothetical protein GX410_01440 [Elusimicrobia bacterium]|nr:hypothetical protein [Elusimicrobiota bacterium]
MKSARVAWPLGCASVILFYMGRMGFAQSTGTVSGISQPGSDIRTQLSQDLARHRAEQQAADAAFEKTLEGKTAQEKQAALAAYAKEQQASELKFRAQMYKKQAAARKRSPEERPTKGMDFGASWTNCVLLG